MESAILFEAGKTNLNKVTVKDLQNMPLELVRYFLFRVNTPNKSILKDLEVSKSNTRYTTFKFKKHYITTILMNGEIEKISFSFDKPETFI